MVGADLITVMALIFYAASCLLSFAAGMFLGVWLKHHE